MATYCNGRHSLKLTPREVPHPAVTMAPVRAQAWEREATDEQFYAYLHEMAAIYAKRHYTGNGVIDSTALFKDYKKWYDSAIIEMSSASSS